MRTKEKDGKKRKLAWEVIEYLAISIAVTIFTFCFLYFTAQSISVNYLEYQEITLSGTQEWALCIWIRGLCVTAGVIVFLFLFLFMLGQRISYLAVIIKGVECLQEKELDFRIPLEGEDELTKLAESINYLSASQQELNQKEEKLKKEREAWIRSLSHDIRTPLTSILAYTELIKSRERIQQEEMRSYIELMQQKAEQIKNLTDLLLGRANENREKMDHVKFLLEQLAEEWEEILEERFLFTADLTDCEDFSGYLDIHAIRRIFDNLLSNVEKYGEESVPVELILRSRPGQICIIQKNGRKTEKTGKESYGIGLESIRRIADAYKGHVEILEEPERFQISVKLSIPEQLQNSLDSDV